MSGDIQERDRDKVNHMKEEINDLNKLLDDFEKNKKITSSSTTSSTSNIPSTSVNPLNMNELQNTQLPYTQYPSGQTQNNYYDPYQLTNNSYASQQYPQSYQYPPTDNSYAFQQYPQSYQYPQTDNLYNSQFQYQLPQTTNKLPDYQ